MSSKIEQIIEEIEEYIDGCKPQTLSKTNIIVNKEEIEELLRELRMKTPEEIKRYQKVLANRDAILADAQERADHMIDESEIVRQAREEARIIKNDARVEASEMRLKANHDAYQLLASVEDQLSEACKTIRRRRAELGDESE